MSQGIRTNSQAASHHRGQIANRGELATTLIPAVVSSTSAATTLAHSSGTRLSGLLSRYQAVVSNSANSISILSSNIISFDAQAGRQIGSG